MKLRERRGFVDVAREAIERERAGRRAESSRRGLDARRRPGVVAGGGGGGVRARVGVGVGVAASVSREDLREGDLIGVLLARGARALLASVRGLDRLVLLLRGVLGRNDVSKRGSRRRGSGRRLGRRGLVRAEVRGALLRLRLRGAEQVSQLVPQRHRLRGRLGRRGTRTLRGRRGEARTRGVRVGATAEAVVPAGGGGVDDAQTAGV